MQNMHLVFIFYFPSLIVAHIGYSTHSYCLDEIPSDKLLLECPDNQLIKLGRIIYGYSWSNDCSYIDKDCTMDVPREDINCFTTTKCTVRVVENPLILQDCWNLAASYVQAEYECITDFSIRNICQSQDVTSSHGFLSTPNYPNGFLANLNCPCTLIASSGHSIVLEIIHFHLPICAEAGLILWLGQDFQTKCLTQDPVTLISNTQQNVTLRFYTLKTNQQGGFLMKYSVLPESNNATIRLRCYAAPVNNRSAVANSFLIGKSLSQNTLHKEDEKEFSVDVSKRLRPSAPINDAPKDVLSINQQLEILNQTIYKKNLLPNSTPLPPTDMTLIITFIVSVVVFIIVINILVWLMCSLRPKCSKSTSSVQNLYAHQASSNTEPKILSNQQLSRPSHRLKTLHSLLYTDPKAIDIDPITTKPNRDSNSALSEYHIPSNSSLTNLNHGFIIKSKSDQTIREPRQINSWDDI